MNSLDELFGGNNIMVILRGLPTVAEAVAAACRAWDAGVELVEVPIGQPDQVPQLAAVVIAGRERGKLVGAGTVITPEHVRTALVAGARYTVAPAFDPEVLHASLAVDLPHLPGVATATEVHHAHRAGCEWVKVFPASTLGPSWFDAIRGPFPHMRYLATGGVTVENAAHYLNAGASIVAFGAGVCALAQEDLAKAMRQLAVPTGPGT